MTDLVERLRDPSSVRSWEDADRQRLEAAAEIERLQSLANDTHDELDERREAAKALEAEIERLRADAARYRWLRTHLGGDAPMIRRAHEVIESEYVWQMDAAIDAAMKETT